MALAQDIDSAQRYCGLSRQLMARRDDYYDALNAVQVGFAEVTASRDLVELLKAGLVVSTGQGRGTRYWVNVPGWTFGPPNKAR